MLLDEKMQNKKHIAHLESQLNNNEKQNKELLGEIQRLEKSNASNVKFTKELQIKLDQKINKVDMYEENVRRFQEEKEQQLKEMTDLFKVITNQEHDAVTTLF